MSVTPIRPRRPRRPVPSPVEDITQSDLAINHTRQRLNNFFPSNHPRRVVENSMHHSRSQPNLNDGSNGTRNAFQHGTQTNGNRIYDAADDRAQRTMAPYYTALDTRSKVLQTSTCRLGMWLAVAIVLNIVLTSLVVLGVVVVSNGLGNIGQLLSDSPTLTCDQLDTETQTAQQTIQEAVKNSIEVTIQGLLSSNNSFHCAAHLFLKYDQRICNKQNTAVNVKSTVLTGWDAADTGFVKNCIELNNITGKLHVKAPGVYVVYTHLAFCETNNKLFLQIIKRRSYSKQTQDGDEEEALLEDRQQVPVSSSGVRDSGEPVYSSVLFATIRLRQNDLIWIEATPEMNIYRANRASYWGIFKLAV